MKNNKMSQKMDNIIKKIEDNTIKDEQKPAKKVYGGDIHKYHRKRLDKKVENDIESLNEYEMLEYILFVIFPRGNTNELAHRLIDTFGSLRGVLNAKSSELQEIYGVGYRTAKFISQLNNVAGIILRNYKNNEHIFDINEETVEYIRSFFVGKETEYAYVFVLDAGRRLISAIKISDGTSSQTVLNFEKIAKVAITNNAIHIVVAHNHPSGDATPSNNDYSATERLDEMLKAIGINLYDSIVIGGDKYYSFRENGHLKRLNLMYKTSKFDEVGYV